LTLAVALLTPATLLQGQSPQQGPSPAVGPIVKIEQDWELVVSTPDPDRCSPQVFAQVYPESGGSFCCQLLINYNDQPTFSAGGVQIQIWQNQVVLDGRDNAPNQAVLQVPDETVKFTLVMEISDGKLNFSAKNVSSTSWGDVNNLNTSVDYEPTAFANYQTSDTLANSGILLGSNRVTSLTLKQVRRIDASGAQITEDAQQIYPPAGSDPGSGSGSGSTSGTSSTSGPGPG
jgi:hypothetical protein